jgi:hypothetical protein
VAAGFEVGAGKAIDGEEDERRHLSDGARKRAAVVEHIERFARAGGGEQAGEERIGGIGDGVAGRRLPTRQPCGVEWL